MALRYKTATKLKKSLNLHEFMEKEMEKKKPKTNLKKKNLNGFKYPVWYPIFDRYSPNQLSQLILSSRLYLSFKKGFVSSRCRNSGKQTWFIRVQHHLLSTSIIINIRLNPWILASSRCICITMEMLLSHNSHSASHPNQQLTKYQNHFMMQHSFVVLIKAKNFNILTSLTLKITQH